MNREEDVVAASQHRAMLRYVLTGTPGAGKTAMLRLLETRGHPVVEEAATDVIALQQALGHDTPWDDPRFIDQVVTLQRRRQSTARPGKPGGPVYFDRSPVCTLALSRFLGHPATPMLAAEIERITAKRIYQPTVFFVRSQGSLHATAERRISYQESLAFECLHERAYRELGFTIADIPAGPLADRVGLVQDIVQRLPRSRRYQAGYAHSGWR